MSKIFSFYKSRGPVSVILSVVLSVLFVVAVVEAATTIGLNINTEGTLTVTGSYSYALMGTTTQSGLSILTLEATSTVAIPLTIRGYENQTADLFRLHDVGGTELFAFDAFGNASTTMISTTGNIWVNGYATTTGSTGAIATEGTLLVTGLSTLLGGATTTTLTLLNGEVISNAIDGTITLEATTMVLVGIASTSAIRVGDKANVSTINGLVFGYCTFAAANVSASSTVMFSCTGATGLVSDDRVFVQATSSLPANFIIQHASTTADGIIQVDIYNTGYLNGVGTGEVTTGVNSLNFWAVR